MNYELELCSAASGRYYVEVYAIGQVRKIVHTTARRDTPEAAGNEARAWIMLTDRRATMTHYAEPAPAA